MSIEKSFEILLSDYINLSSLCDGKHGGDVEGCDICLAKKTYDQLAQLLKDNVYIQDEQDDKPSTFLTGSYARHTMIRPPKDIDFFLVLDKKEYHDDILDELLSPKELLQRLFSVMKDIQNTIDGIEIVYQSHSITIVFTDNFSVDVIPSFESDDGESYLIPSLEIDEQGNILNTGEYISSNPKIHYDYINRINDKSSSNSQKRMKKIVRLVKFLKRRAFSEGDWKMRSFHLELLVAATFEKNKISSISKGLEVFLNRVPLQLSDPGLQDPANEENIIDDYFIEKPTHIQQEIIDEYKHIGEIAVTAVEYEEADDIDSALNEWEKIFPEINARKTTAEMLVRKIEEREVYEGTSVAGLKIGGESSDDQSRKVASSSSWRKPR